MNDVLFSVSTAVRKTAKKIFIQGVLGLLFLPCAGFAISFAPIPDGTSPEERARIEEQRLKALKRWEHMQAQKALLTAGRGGGITPTPIDPNRRVVGQSPFPEICDVDSRGQKSCVTGRHASNQMCLAKSDNRYPYKLVGKQCAKHESCQAIKSGALKGYYLKSNIALNDLDIKDIRPNMISLAVLNNEKAKLQNKINHLNNELHSCLQGHSGVGVSTGGVPVPPPGLLPASKSVK